MQYNSNWQCATLFVRKAGVLHLCNFGKYIKLPKCAIHSLLCKLPGILTSKTLLTPISGLFWSVTSFRCKNGYCSYIYRNEYGKYTYRYWWEIHVSLLMDLHIDCFMYLKSLIVLILPYRVIFQMESPKINPKVFYVPMIIM